MTHRNEFCLCRSGKPTKFCLCVEPKVLLCSDCRLQHLQDLEKEEFHDLYPYEMIEIYERLGKEGLIRRKNQLKAAKNAIQLFRDLETEEYTAVLDSITGARHAVELVHRSFQELFASANNLLQKTLIKDVVLEVEGFASAILAQGNRKQGTEAFAQVYSVQSAKVLCKAYLQLSTENVEEQLLEILSLERKGEVSSTRLKKSATHKTLPRDSAGSRSGYLTPRRSCKPKLSPYHPIIPGKVSAKRKNSAHRDNTYLSTTSQLLLEKSPGEENLFRSEFEQTESYLSPSVLARASGKNSRIGKQNEDAASSFERSFVKKKHPSEAGIRKDGEGEFAEYLEGIQSVVKKTIKLQRKLGRSHY